MPREECVSLPHCCSLDRLLRCGASQRMEKPMFKDKYVKVNGVRLALCYRRKRPR